MQSMDATKNTEWVIVGQNKQDCQSVDHNMTTPPEVTANCGSHFPERSVIDSLEDSYHGSESEMNDGDAAENLLGTGGSLASSRNVGGRRIISCSGSEDEVEIFSPESNVLSAGGRKDSKGDDHRATSSNPTTIPQKEEGDKKQPPPTDLSVKCSNDKNAADITSDATDAASSTSALIGIQQTAKSVVAGAHSMFSSLSSYVTLPKLPPQKQKSSSTPKASSTTASSSVSSILQNGSPTKQIPPSPQASEDDDIDCFVDLSYNSHPVNNHSSPEVDLKEVNLLLSSSSTPSDTKDCVQSLHSFSHVQNPVKCLGLDLDESTVGDRDLPANRNKSKNMKTDDGSDIKTNDCAFDENGDIFPISPKSSDSGGAFISALTSPVSPNAASISCEDHDSGINQTGPCSPQGDPETSLSPVSDILKTQVNAIELPDTLPNICDSLPEIAMENPKLSTQALIVSSDILIKPTAALTICDNTITEPLPAINSMSLSSSTPSSTLYPLINQPDEKSNSFDSPKRDYVPDSSEKMKNVLTTAHSCQPYHQISLEQDDMVVALSQADASSLVECCDDATHVMSLPQDRQDLLEDALRVPDDCGHDGMSTIDNQHQHHTFFSIDQNSREPEENAIPKHHTQIQIDNTTTRTVQPPSHLKLCRTTAPHAPYSQSKEPEPSPCFSPVNISSTDKLAIGGGVLLANKLLSDTPIDADREADSAMPDFSESRLQFMTPASSSNELADNPHPIQIPLTTFRFHEGNKETLVIK